MSLLQVALPIGFLFVTALYLGLTIVNRQRLERVLITVPAGRLFRIPTRPAAFALVLLAILIAGRIAGASVSPVLMFGYVFGAILWGVATHIGTSTYVFQSGIIRSLIDRDTYLPWSVVEDYFYRDRGPHRVEFVFLHRDLSGRQSRYEVSVPRKCAVEFSQIVEDILETRFTVRLQRSRIRRELKGM